MNHKAKSLTIFLVTLSILFLCVILIISFLLREETNRRMAVEKSLNQVTAAKIELERQLGDAKKQMVFLQERIKESDLKIKGLISELDLSKSQQEVLTKENTDLKEAIAKEQKEKADLDHKMNQAVGELNALKEKLIKSEKTNQEKKTQASGKEVPLGTIVVNPSSPEGPAAANILTINKEYQFVVTNLGVQDSAAPDQILIVTRDNQEIGKLKIQRVQGNLSVADPIPPLKVEILKEGDRVSIKQ